MDIFEFDLRYIAFEGFARLFGQSRNQQQLIELVRLRQGITLDKKIQDVTPAELKELTESTYSTFKQEFLSDSSSIMLEGGSLSMYVERLEYELKVIKEMGFNTYFLIVGDFVQWSRNNQIMVGPGRGSGAGSLLAYCLRITDVDPLPYGLLFERFLNPARITMPDFDIDFEDTLRDQVISYVTERYGHDKVCAIGTYMQLAPKAAFKDAARTLGMPFDRANLVSNMVVDADFKTMLADPKTYEEFVRLYDQDPIVKQAVDLSIKLQGNLRQLGVHACGIIISPDPVVQYSALQPVMRGSNETATMVSQYDGKVMEMLGLLKMDFLGLRNLSVIKNCIKIIRAQYLSTDTPLPQLFVDYFETMSFTPPLDDLYTFEKVFQSGDTTGIFQFEGDGMRRFLIQLKSTHVNDLVAMNALYRPGPMDFIPRYIARKHGEEEVEYMPPELRTMLTERYDEQTADAESKKLWEDLDPIMGLTYGIAVYQEQLMFLVQSMAGFSLAEADILRRGVGKKILEVIEKLKKEFVVKSADYRDYKPETSTWIYEKMIEPAARYSFNKSHSVCYSLIAYQTGYLKAHYPVEFYAALLRSKEEDTERLSMFISEVKEHNISVLLPDVNESFNHVAAVDGDVRLGFLSIKGVGYDIGEYIEQERKRSGVFATLEDFLQRCQSVINKKSLEGLIKSGALDRFGSRQTFLSSLNYLLDRGKQSKQAETSLFGGTDLVSTIHFEQKIETTLMDTMMMEYGVFNTFVSVHPFDGLYPFLKKHTFITQMEGEEQFGGCELICFVKEIRRARKKGFFVTIEDATGTLDMFLKDKMNIKLFDVLLISGYMGRRLSLNKIESTDIQSLRDEVMRKGLYDESMTVAKVRQLRGSNVTPLTSPTLSMSEQVDDAHEEEVDLFDELEETTLGAQENEVRSFAMPDTIPGMVAVRKIVADSDGGDIAVMIGTKNYQLTATALAKLESLLG